MNLEKIHALGCDLSDPRVEETLSKITAIKSLAFPVVCLPDLHLKERTEGPSSFAAATEGTMVPDLTAPSVGCGMGILTTSLSTRDIDHVFFKKFYESMRGELGPRYGRLKNALLWLGIFGRPRKKYDLSKEEFEDMIKRGAEAAIERYNLPKETLYHVEYNGSAFSQDERDALRFRDILPRISYRSGRHDLGYGFKGNHFLEIQYVDDVLDQECATSWGLEKNQVVIMYHGGGGAVSYHIGRYFANRKKNTFGQKIVLAFFKILFHFGNPAHWNSMRERFRYYFMPSPFLEIPLNSQEGMRLMRATKASLNYSYGFRMAMIRRIIDSMEAAFPEKKPRAQLLWDCIHNTIREEAIASRRVVVHRHTANRVFEGKPVIVSGFNTTSSYIAVGLPGAEKHLFSSDHGAGVTIKKFEAKGHMKDHPKHHTTHIYQTKTPYKQIVPQKTDEGVDSVLTALKEEGIIRPVVRLRPLAVFKG